MHNRKKISLIGAGNIGGAMAYLVAIKNLGDVVLIDIAKKIAQGKARDVLSSLPITETNINITGSDNYN